MVHLDVRILDHVERDRRAAIDANPLIGRELPVQPHHQPVAIGVRHAEFCEFFTDQFVLFFVLPVPPCGLGLLILRLLQLAGKLDHDLMRRPVGVDHGVDHRPHLVERDMHRRVGHPPDPFMATLRRARIGDHMARHRLAVIGQPRMPSLFEVRVVQAEPVHRLVIDERPLIEFARLRIGGLRASGFHLIDEFGQNAAPDMAMALRQPCLAGRLGLRFRKTAILHQPLDERALVRFAEQPFDDFRLACAGKAAPRLAEACALPGLGEDRRRLIGVEPPPFAAFKVKACIVRQL